MSDHEMRSDDDWLLLLTCLAPAPLLVAYMAVRVFMDWWAQS